MDQKELIRQKTSVTYVAALVNLFLSVIKVVFGVLGQSTALIADGIHSLSDLVSDAFVLIAVKLGSREADHDHPYGHGRFETIAAVVLGLVLIVVAGGIAGDALDRLLHPDKLLIPKIQALGIAAISILSNEWLFHYTRRVAKKTRSKLLLANAWHHRSDAISSIVVLFGIGAVLYGYPFADAIAAVIVGLMVAKIGLNLVLESLKELVDTSLPASYINEIRSKILAIDGILGIHLLRTRQMGEDAYIDVHIVVNPRITVSECHMIADIVRDTLKEEFDDIVDVLVHIDPEDDQYRKEKSKLPARQELITDIKIQLGAFSELIQDIKIHYLDGSVELEVILPYSMITRLNEWEIIKWKCGVIEQKMNVVSKVWILFKA